jgi:hypothetical protein
MPTPPTFIPRSRTRRKEQLRQIRLRTLDMRTKAGQFAAARRQELVLALGGEDEITPQQRHLVDMIVAASAYLNHVDAFLFGQERLVSDAGLHPVLLQRQSVATHLARLLDQIGLDRVARKVDSLEAYRARFEQEEEVDGQQVEDQAQEPQDEPTAAPGA